MHDITGGYNRFDIFDLRVNRKALAPVRFDDALVPDLADEDGLNRRQQPTQEKATCEQAGLPSRTNRPVLEHHDGNRNPGDPACTREAVEAERFTFHSSRMRMKHATGEELP